MDFGLTGRRAAVAGASAGLGLATAEALAAEGATVAICGRNPERLHAVANERGYHAVAFALNALSTITMCLEAVPEMRAQGWGRIVAVTSIAARQASPHLILSATARAGVTGF